MAINPIKKMPTEDCNSTAGETINDLNYPTGQRSRKAFHDLRAAFALKGYSLHRCYTTDGAMSYLVSRWGMVRFIGEPEEAQAYLERIGGAS